MRGGPKHQCQREASHKHRSLKKGRSERGSRRDEDPRKRSCQRVEAVAELEFIHWWLAMKIQLLKSSTSQLIRFLTVIA